MDIIKDYRKITVEDYLDELSSRKMVPGGGSASALNAALGAGLNLMVMNYTVDPSGGDESTKELISLKERQSRIMKDLASLIDEDCEVFRSLMKALKEKKDARESYKAAAEVPMKICRKARESMAISEQVAAKAKTGIATDIGCAAYFLKGAFYAARLNVNINLAHIADEAFVEEVKSDILAMSADIEIMSESIQVILEIR